MGVPAEPHGAGRAHAAAASTDEVAAGNRRDVGARVYPGGFAGLTARGKAVLAWWQRTRAARANARFGEAGGGVLTGGIAYATIFSVFAGLTIGYSVFMAVLGNNEALRQTVLDTIDANLPGLVMTSSDDKTGVIDPDTLQLSTGVGVAGLVAFVVLLVSAISAMAALRTAVRAMFGAEGGGNAVTGKLRELAGFAGIGLAILVSALLSIATTTAADWALTALGLDGSTVGSIVLRGAGILVAFVVDAGTFALIVLVLAGQRPAWPDLRQGMLVAAVGLGVVRVLGTSVVAGSADRNAILASFAVIVTLLIWINLIARIVLLAAAWTADPPPADEAQPADTATDGADA
ncbi:YihY/virulence factor BrkB family protein [Cellulomonas sp. IC4_254]|uniref:YihY/virulence factor BrkB family protein n=1 Tax=Cellulomonas sp. IC4_254 TaxID=2714040 RepID=UPI00141F9378|nr:YihY/virulence factor BrkB family protein [Cellulomonas sp. IC4_254]NHT18926.1 YihY/virulence factor BrkB family protein [Cellulomonas sp. IC4_254]